MIKGIEDKPRLSTKEIFKRISDSDIYQFYLGRVIPGRCMKSPFHVDENPSFYINNKDGHYKHCDLADSKYFGDCFDLVQQLFGLNSLMEAMEKVDLDFGLGFGGTPKKDYKRIVENFSKQPPKPPTFIEVSERAFTLRELEWWNRMLQSKDDLKREHIVAIEKFWVNGKQKEIRGDEMAFGYFFPEINKWKIYFPERSKQEAKWFSNLPTSVVERKEQLIGGKKGIIQKSRKDRMVCQKLFPFVCSVQNETRSAFVDEFRDFLESNLEEVYIFFDSDAAGKKNSHLITGTFGYKHLNTPDHLQQHGIKDISGWVYHSGYEPAEKFLRERLNY